MYEYVQVPVPAPLVPTVIGLVAEFLSDGGSEGHEDMPGNWWMTFATERQGARQWWEALRPGERQLLRILAEAPGHSLETTMVAKQLHVTARDLAGILGPLNRRARQDGYPAPVNSRQQRAPDRSGRRIKVLSLAEGVENVVARYDTGEASTRRPAVRPRARSQGAKDVFGDR